jgi:antitoxin component YwqK of YwqJK toxin-antitoxin module
MWTMRLPNFSLILVFNLLIIFTLSAQNTIDAQGKKQGKWVKYQNSNKFYEGQFVDDVPVGEFKYYYPNGHLKIRTIYTENGRLNRTKIFFDAFKEKLKAEGNYFDKKKDSTWNYYNEAGYLISIENYRNGLKSGEYKVFNYVGQLHLEEYYQNDTITGTSIEYFENGALFRSIIFKNGKRCGVFKLFYPEGNIKLLGNYKQDIRDSVWTTYTEDGQIEILDYYVKGFLQMRTDKDGKELKIIYEEETKPLNIDPSVFDPKL